MTHEEAVYINEATKQDEPRHVSIENEEKPPSLSILGTILASPFVLKTPGAFCNLLLSAVPQANRPSLDGTAERGVCWRPRYQGEKHKFAQATKSAKQPCRVGTAPSVPRLEGL